MFLVCNDLPFDTMVIMAHFFLYNTHECQETQIKNSFDSILNFGLIKNF
jgi:hypothetical protein